jgi:hypothetical protein
MNSAWMTTLISKKQELETWLEKQMSERGVKLHPADVADFVEKWSPRASQEALSYVLDVTKPFLMGLGFRISKLSQTQIEVVIPYRRKSLNESLEIHEGVLLSAGTEAVRWLWSKQSMLGQFQADILEIRWNKLKKSLSGQKLRYEVTSDQREVVLSHLRLNRQEEIEAYLYFYDENDQLTSELQMKVRLHHQPALETSRT